MKSIGTAADILTFYPDFKPPSPENPSRPLRASFRLGNRILLGCIAWDPLLHKISILIEQYELKNSNANKQSRERFPRNEGEAFPAFFIPMPAALPGWESYRIAF